MAAGRSGDATGRGAAVSATTVRAGGRMRTLGGVVAAADDRLSLGQVRILVIMAGGALGTLARAGVAEAVPHRPAAWPWATFAVNLAGAFILGWLLTRLAERTAPSRHWRFFLGTGFCGALTTFSTLQIETFELAHDGHVGLAVGYPVASIAAGMAVAVAGVMVARWGRHW